MKKTKLLLSTLALTLIGANAANAVALELADSFRGANAINGIAVTNVTGNAGGASEVWGTYDGNDPGPSGDGFVINSTETFNTDTFNFLAKYDVSGTGGSLSGTDIGLSITGQGTSSGTWEFNDTLTGDYLIVLKAANSPGYAAWLFSGDDSLSTSGDWLVAWTTGGGPNPANPALSHIAIYQADSRTPGEATPDTGATVALMGFALAGLGLLKRRK